jgi:hypothetical protein
MLHLPPPTPTATQQGLDLKNAFFLEQRVATNSPEQEQNETFARIARHMPVTDPTPKDIGQVPSTPSGLSPEMISSLREASAHHEVVLLEREFAGSKQFVAVAGEFHYKTAAAAQEGEKLIAAFSVRGYEGWQMNPLSVGDWCIKVLSAVPTMFNAILEKFNSQSQASPLKGSTIDSLHLAAANGDIPTLIHLEQGDKKITLAGELSKILFCFPFLTTGYFLLRRAVHKLSRSEQPCRHFNNSAIQARLYYGIMSIQITSVLASVLPSHLLQNNSPLGIVADLTKYGIVGQRDDLMARNIGRYFVEYPKSSPLLCVIGKGHVPGVVERLQGEGWKQVDLARVSE